MLEEFLKESKKKKVSLSSSLSQLVLASSSCSCNAYTLQLMEGLVHRIYDKLSCLTLSHRLSLAALDL